MLLELKFEPLKFQPPETARKILSCGATVFLLPDHELPLINISAYIKTGTMYDAVNKIGVASLCGSMIRAGGTTSRKAEEIDDKLEFLGASVETGIDTELGSASLFVLRKDLDQGLEIFADVLMNPAFRKKNLKIEKAKIIEGIRRRNDDPYQIARREFRKLLYGRAHPLSRTLEIPAVKKISRKDLVDFYEKYFHPNNMMFAVSGDFNPDEMIQKLETLFKNWSPEKTDYPPVIEVQKWEGKSRLLGIVDKKLNQSSILLGHLGVKRHNPDHFTLEVMNEILGGSSFTSRLYKEVRTRLGLAYWVGSSISEPWDYGIIAAGCQTKNETVGQAIKAIEKEIRRIREEKVSEDELRKAKDSIINSFVFRYASSHAIVTQKMSLEYFGYSQDYLDGYTDKISLVTSEDILETAKKVLKPESLYFVVVGNQKEMDQPLSNFGMVKPIDIKIPE